MFTKYLSSLINNDQLRKEMSEKGNHVFEDFHYTRLAKDVGNLYTRLLNRVTEKV